MFLKIPPRSEKSFTGSAFINYIETLPPEDRDEAIYIEILKGNIPNFLRNFVKIEFKEKDARGKTHNVVLRVLPDYLSIGSNDNFVRIPMTPQTAQRIANYCNCLLPTKKIVDKIWYHGTVKLNPQPIDIRKYDITSPSVFLLHNKLIEEQRKVYPLGVLTVGHKKDIVITNKLLKHPDRVAIYGWHYPNGKPIQPLSIVHKNTYYDYSHGVRLIKNFVLVDGKEIVLEELLKDPILNTLVSDEGIIYFTRYPIK